MASIGRRGEDQDAKEPLLTPKESSQGDVKQATKHEDDEDDQDSWSNWVTLGLMFATIVCVAGTVLISAGFELPSSLQNFFDGILGTSSPSGVDGPAAYCSGHGIQISLKSCVCDLGYAGNLCQDVIDIPSVNREEASFPLPINRRTVCFVLPYFGALNPYVPEAAAYSDIVRTIAHGTGKDDEMDVTVLYIGEEDKAEVDVWSRVVNDWKQEGISVQRLPSTGLEFTKPGVTSLSYEVFRFFKSLPSSFSTVHFLASTGAGFYTMKAQKQGLVCFGTQFIVHADTIGEQTLRRIASANMNELSAEILKKDYMSQKMVEMADAVLTTTADIGSDLFEQKWQLPEEVYSVPFIPSLPADGEVDSRIKRRSLDNIVIDEIVFVGLLADTRGLQMFCDAVDIMDEANVTPQTRSSLKVTFLGEIGKFGDMPGDEYVESRSLSWNNVEWDVKPKARSVADIVAYMTDTSSTLSLHRLAVIAIPYDASGYLYSELVRASIPVIATRLPVYEAALDPLLHSELLFEALSGDLARSVSEKVTDGVIAPVARLSAGNREDSVKNWLEVFRRTASAPVTCKTNYIKPNQENLGDDNTDEYMEGPLISVVLVHRNRHQLLEQAIKSLEEQTFTNFEIVLVDDGSDDPETLQYLQDLAWKWWEERGWRVIREPNRYLGAARNTGVKYAKGRYILFMDDDDYAKPHQLATLARVVSNTKADIVTAGHDIFEGLSLPPGSGTGGRYLPLGPSAVAGLLENVFGDSNMLVERDFFIDTGGFSETFGVGFEDYEFFAKSVLRGANLEAIPESLHWYRRHPGAMSYNTDLKAGQVRYLKPYLEAERTVDVSTKEVIGLAKRRFFDTFPGMMYVLLNVTGPNPPGPEPFCPNSANNNRPCSQDRCCGKSFPSQNKTYCDFLVGCFDLVSVDSTVFPVMTGQTIRASVTNLGVFITPNDIAALKCSFTFSGANITVLTQAIIVDTSTLLCSVPTTLDNFTPGPGGWQFSIQYPTDSAVTPIWSTRSLAISPYPGTLSISAGASISKVRPATSDVQGSFFIGTTCNIPVTFTSMNYSRFTPGSFYEAYCSITNVLGSGGPTYVRAAPVNTTYGAYSCPISCGASAQYRVQLTLNYRPSTNSAPNLLAGSVVVNIYDSAPTILKAILDDTGASIKVSFSKAIRVRGFTSLPARISGSQVFDSTVSSLLVGGSGSLNDVVIQITNSVTLLVSLPFSSTLSFSGDWPNLSFKNLAIFSSLSIFDDFADVKGPAMVLPPESPPTPVAVIDGPDGVAYCDSATITGLSSYNLGGRAGIYSWSVAPNDADVAALFTSSKGAVTLSSTILTAHKGATYAFSLTVANWLGRSSTTVTKTLKISNQAIPRVRILGGSRQNITSGNVLTLKSEAVLSSCQTNANSALVFQWSYSPISSSFESAFATMKNTPIIAIPFASLSPTQSYTFTLMAYPDGQPDASASASVVVQPFLQNIFVSLGARQRTISASTASTFFAIYQDLSALSLSSRVITWTATLNGTGTNYPLDAATQGGTSLTIRAGTLTAGTVVLLSVLAEARDGTGRSTSASVAVTVVGGNALSAYSFVTAPNYGATTILQSDSLQVRAFVDQSSVISGGPSVSYSWSSVSGTATDPANTPLSIASLDSTTLSDGVQTAANLNFAPGALIAGAYYRFQCLVSQSGTTSTTTSVDIKVASLPANGIVAVSPNTGIKALKTTVTLSASYWTIVSSEQPLTYRFNIYVPDTLYGTPNALPAIQISTDRDTSVDTILPISSTSQVLIELVVRSSVTKASTTTTMTVPVANDVADWTEFGSLNSAALSDARKAGNVASINRVIQIFATSMKQWKPPVSLPSALSVAIVNSTLSNVFGSNVISPDACAERIATVSSLVDSVSLGSDQGSQIGFLLANDIKSLESQQMSNPTFSISDNDLKSYYKAFSGVLTSYSDAQVTANQSETLISGINSAQRLNLRSMACGQKGKSVTFGELSTSIGKADLSSSGSVDSGNGTNFGFGSGMSLSNDGHAINCFCTQAMNSPPYQFGYVTGLAFNQSVASKVTTFTLSDCSEGPSFANGRLNPNASVPVNSSSNEITFTIPISSSATLSYNAKNQAFLCQFVDPVTQQYSTAGVTTIRFDNTTGTLYCKTNHLTSFNGALGPLTLEFPNKTSTTSNVNVGAIVGGVIGGAALVALVAGSVYYVKKKKSSDVPEKIPPPQNGTQSVPEMQQKSAEQAKHEMKPNTANQAESAQPSIRAPPSLESKAQGATSEPAKEAVPTSNLPKAESLPKVTPPQMPAPEAATPEMNNVPEAAPVPVITYIPRYIEREEIAGMPPIRFGPRYELPLEYSDAMRLLGLSSE